MADVVMIGGGIAGLGGAMLLARAGHRVTVLERNPAPSPLPELACDQWERRGVPQFRLPHAFLPRFRAELESELPDVAAAIEAAGALRTNRVAALPAEMTGGWREGDERFDVLTGRRPMVEAVLAIAADREPGVEVRRGATVRGLVAVSDGPGPIPHVKGVLTDDGGYLRADLVVDAGGRRSQLANWLEAVGCRPCINVEDDSGFVYYARNFRSTAGATPAPLAALNQPYDSLNWITIAADRNHWSIVLCARADDAAMRATRDVRTWTRLAASYPLVAHWLEGEPLSGVDVIASISNRVRDLWVDGEPVATGIVPVGDAAACTSPSVGRGATIALLHAICLRDALHDATAAATPIELAERIRARSADVVTPLVNDTLALDRHRIAEIGCQIEGRPYRTDDPSWAFGKALGAAIRSDPDLLRAHADVAGLLRRGVEIARQPDVVDRVLAATPTAPPGPDRDEVLAIVGEQRRRRRRPGTHQLVGAGAP